jgi:hypothetical protein
MFNPPSFLKSAAVVSAMFGTTASAFSETNNDNDVVLEYESQHPLPDPAYKREIEEWRKKYEANLRKENGWLTVAGLYWLKHGENWLGTIPSSTIQLPKKAPATLGSLRLEGDTANPRIHFFAVTAVPVRVLRGNGTESNILHDSSQTLAYDDDSGSKPDVITIGELSMYVVRRTNKSGTRFAIRLKDNGSEARKHFKGNTWFAVKPEYRITARFVQYEQPKTVEIENILGGIEKHTTVGYAEFRIGKNTYTLDAEREGDKLFFNFKDETSGKATYPAGRFLYADLPQNGVVTLDFNKAENPPCAFTSFATCPLPPRKNWLKTRIEAGEKTHHPYDETHK